MASCVVPGGIYKGYEGPDRAPEHIAVLEWSADPYSMVIEIDGVNLHEGQLLFGGVATTIAQLPPGTYDIRVNNNYSDYLNSGADVTLTTRFEAGQAYKLRVDPCKDCDLFSVHFSIVDSVTGEVAAEGTRYGSKSYREFRREEREEEREACESRCARSCWLPWNPDDDDLREYRECEDEVDECEDDCKPFLPW